MKDNQIKSSKSITINYQVFMLVNDIDSNFIACGHEKINRQYGNIWI